MQNHFTYDELTPLEQCIADFAARQELNKRMSPKKKEATTPTRQ